MHLTDDPSRWALACFIVVVFLAFLGALLWSYVTERREARRRPFDWASDLPEMTHPKEAHIGRLAENAGRIHEHTARLRAEVIEHVRSGLEDQ